MKPHLQRSERQRLALGQDQLAVEHEPLLLQRAQRLDDLGEIAPERLARLRSQLDGLAIAEGEAAEAVPLGLELPALPVGNRIGQPRFHRRGFEGNRECHEG